MCSMDVTLLWVLCGTLPFTVRVLTWEEWLPLRMTSAQCLSLWWHTWNFWREVRALRWVPWFALEYLPRHTWCVAVLPPSRTGRVWKAPGSSIWSSLTLLQDLRDLFS